MCDESAYSYHVVHVLCRNCERRRHSGHDYRLSPLTLVTSLWERWYVIFWPRASPTAVCQSVAEYYEAYLRQPVASAVSGLRGVYSDTTQLNWTQLNQLNSVQPSQSCFVYDVMTYKLSQLLFTLWTCRQLDVELSSVELSCVAINTPLVESDMLACFTSHYSLLPARPTYLVPFPRYHHFFMNQQITWPWMITMNDPSFHTQPQKQ